MPSWRRGGWTLLALSLVQSLAILAQGLENPPAAQPSPSAPCAADAYEPDDACGTAPPVAVLGQLQARNFCDDAMDWLRIPACAGTDYLFETSGLRFLADTVLELYAPDCTTLLVSDDDGGGGRASRLAWRAPSDGDYFLLVRQKNGTAGASRQYDLLVTSDAASGSLWSTILPELTNSGPADLAVSWDGSAYVASTFGQVVAKMTADGVVEWAYSFAAIGSDEGACLAATPDGGVVLLGTDNTGWSQPLLLWLDRSGAIVRQRLYSSFWGWTPRKVRPAADGGFWLLGEDHALTPPAVAVVRLDAQGGILWQRLFRLPITAPRDRPGGPARDLLPTSDGGALFAAGANLSWGNEGNHWVVKLDGSGAIQWQELLATDAYRASFTTLTALPAGGYLLAGTYNSPPGFSYGAAWLVRLGENGSLLWERQYTSAYMGYGTGVLALTDGGFLLLSSSSMVDQPTLVRTDALGAIVGQWAFGVGVSGDLFHLAKGCGDSVWAAGYGLEALSAWLVRTDLQGRMAGPCPFPAPGSLGVASLALTTVAAAAGEGAAASYTAGAAGHARSPFPLGPVRACPAELPTEVSPPGSSEPLRVDPHGDGSKVRWSSPQESGSLAFCVYQGTLGGVRAGDYGACVALGVNGTEWTLFPDTSPAPGECLTFLVGGVNYAGPGTLGHRSDGTERTIGYPCPMPSR